MPAGPSGTPLSMGVALGFGEPHRENCLELLKSRRLRSTAVASRREEAWYGALALLGRGYLHAGPIKLEDLKRTVVAGGTLRGPVDPSQLL